MDPLLLLKAAILGVVEGLTEFLPVSSTGHLILAATLLDFHDARGKLFEIVIQSGAILAVVWEFRARLGSAFANATTDPKARRLLVNILIAFMPLALLGLLFGKALKAGLFNATTVAAAFIVGGFVILWAERRSHQVRVESVDDMTALDALKVGIAQAFALIPGTSRSGATIIGGMLFGLSRKVATEFTFYLAIPTLGIASLYSLYKERELLSLDDLGALGRRHGVGLRLGVRVRALADPLRGHAHLRAIRLVPHRLRRAGADHCLHRRDRLERLRLRVTVRAQSRPRPRNPSTSSCIPRTPSPGLQRAGDLH